MRNTIDYLIVTAIGLSLTFMVIQPVVKSVAQSMDASANMIATAQRAS